VANPTTNYGFVMPTPTDLVTDLPADFGVFGQAVDTQMKTNADAATQKATLTTKGDIYAATGTSTPARLAVGANNQVLTADSSTATGLKWATAASGSMTLISTTTLTGATVTLSSIPQTYKDLRMEMKDFLHTGGGNNTVQFRVNSTSGIYDTNNSSEAGPASAYTATYGELTGGYTQPAVTDNFSISEFYDYTNTTTYKYVDTKNMGSAGASVYATENLRTGIRSTSAISAIELSLAAGSFNGGTVLLYGVN
jgi:hypothetical protein